MNTLLLAEKTVDEKSIAPPFITVALQIDPFRNSKAEIEQKIKSSIGKIENDFNLMKGVHEYIVSPALSKLKHILNNLQPNINKKSFVIFLSPFIEKTYYLNSLVEEKAVVGEPLNMRELIATQRQEVAFLVLSLTTTNSSVYIGDSKKLTTIAYNSTAQVKPNFKTGKESFFLHVDNVLTHILKAYPLPLLAMGTEPVLSLFQSVSKNTKEIMQTIYCDKDSEAMVDIARLIRPVICPWEKLKENFLLSKLKKALASKTAVAGIHKVSHLLKGKRGRLLIAEKDFSYAFRFTDRSDISCAKAVSSEGPLFVCDAIEDCIESVLAEGGDVEFVNNGVLEEHIALIM